MKTFLSISLSLCTLSLCTAQQIVNDYVRFYPHAQKFESSQNYVQAQGSYEFNSNAISNGFFKRFAENGYIDNDLKASVSKRLKSTNRYLYAVNANLMGQVSITEKTAILGGLEVNQQNYTQFSKDAFNLVFYGNKPFAGENANLNTFKFSLMSYQSVFMGVKKAHKTGNWWSGLAGIRGGTLRDIELKKGKLYTEVDGSYLEASGTLQTAFSDNKPSFISTSNGLGLSTFFGYDLKFKKNAFGIAVSDLGFINWKNLNKYSADGTYRFEGKDIENIFSLNDSIYQNYNADSLAAEVGIKKSKGNKVKALPALIQLNYSHTFSNRFFLISGLKYRLFSGYVPMLYARPVYSLNNKFFVHSQLSLGGYGKADIEIGFSALIRSNFSLTISANALEFVTAPNHSSGNGISLSFQRNL